MESAEYVGSRPAEASSPAKRWNLGALSQPHVSPSGRRWVGAISRPLLRAIGVRQIGVDFRGAKFSRLTQAF
jgi:hypothetical protein